MTESTGKVISDLMSAIGAQLADSIRLVQSTWSEEVFLHYRLQVAMLMSHMQDRVMNLNREQAKTSSANLLCRSPAQSCRGVRSFFASAFAAVKAPAR